MLLCGSAGGVGSMLELSATATARNQEGFDALALAHRAVD
jgi:hypothetical protein